MDTTNEQEEASSGSGQLEIPKEQENQYWTKVTSGQLQESVQAKKPSTSKKVTKKPNVPLDDSTVPCSICLSDMREEDQENDDVVVQLTMCTHMFHEECIRVRFFTI